MSVPLLAIGQVVSHDSKGGGVYVIFKNSGQMLSAPVQIMYDGPADAYRVNQESMPGLGTWGLIAFPDGDARNGMWIKSVYASQVNAITSDTEEPFTKYYAHQSGFWSILDINGDSTTVYPDGTSVTISETGNIPATYRNTVENQVQTRVQLTQAERVPNPPAPKIINIITASGVTLNIDASGNVTLGVAGNLTGTVDGNANITVKGTADITIDGDATASANSWNITGNVTWNGDMQVNGTITASSSISDHNGAYGTVNNIRYVYNGHAHNGVQTGTGTTDVPDNLLAT